MSTTKAQENTLLWWVFGVAVLIVIIIAVQAIGKYLYPSGQQAASCRATIEAMSKEQGSILSYFNSGTKVPLMCETNWVGNLTVKEKNPDKQRDELLGQVVPLVRECWDEFGDGNLDPFANEFLSSNHYCFVCSRFIIDFDKMTKLSGADYFELTEADFINYTERAKFGNMYYYDYFGDAFPLGSPMMNKVDVSNIAELSITDIFYPADSFVDGGYEHNDYAVVLFAFAPKKGAEAVGIVEPKYNVFVIPYDNLGSMGCNELVKKKRTE